MAAAAKTKTVGSRKSHQSLEQSAGTPEPADPAAFHCVEPGETAREYFSDSLTGLVAADARAGFLSVGLPPQRVVTTREQPRGPLPPCKDKVISRWRGGVKIFAASARAA